MSRDRGGDAVSRTLMWWKMSVLVRAAQWADWRWPPWQRRRPTAAAVIAGR